MSKIVLLGIVLGVACAVASAQTGDADVPHPIDAAMTKCLATAHATMPRAECYATASKAWDNEVVTKYAALQKLIPAKQLPDFRASQSTWLRYRDAQFVFYQAADAKQRGSMHISQRQIERMSIVRARALILDDLYVEYKR